MNAHTIFLYLMACLYIAAGVYHFIKPRMYMRIMPPWLPWHLQLVWISGVCEIVLGILLFWPATRSFAAWGIIVLLIAVFPANVEMMKQYRQRHHRLYWVTLVRLPLQIALIAWAWLYT